MVAKRGDLQVWWIPQIPMEAFCVPVNSPETGWWLVDILAKYDLFQLEHHIKPDFSNVGGVQIFENDEWIDLEEPEQEDD